MTMIGTVRDDGTPILLLTLQGPSGIEIKVPFVVDTGFTSAISLPQDFVDALGLPFREVGIIFVANEGVYEISLYEGAVVWDGAARATTVHCLAGEPLVGLELLMDHLLTLPVRSGETFTIRRLA